MSGNTFKIGETLAIEAELTGLDTSISAAQIEINDNIDNTPVIFATTMEETGNQCYRYYFDTRNNYFRHSGFSGWSGTSGSSYWSGTSGAWSGWSGYATSVSGIYTAKITATDSNNHAGIEIFRIRIS